jgi:hypothetical protein
MFQPSSSQAPSLGAEAWRWQAPSGSQAVLASSELPVSCLGLTPDRGRLYERHAQPDLPLAVIRRGAMFPQHKWWLGSSRAAAPAANLTTRASLIAHLATYTSQDLRGGNRQGVAAGGMNAGFSARTGKRHDRKALFCGRGSPRHGILVDPSGTETRENLGRGHQEHGGHAHLVGPQGNGV